MNGDTYYLIDSADYPVARFMVEEAEKCYVSGDCFVPYSWCNDKTIFEEYFFADMTCKWDGCTHWMFRGEDYNSETDQNEDCYYHICGEHYFQRHIRTMCFVWKIVSDIMESRVKDNYFEDETTRKLVDLMLEGYTIKKVEKESETRI